MLTWLLAASPIIVPAALLLSGRAGAIGAGGVGLMLALFAAVVASPADAVGVAELGAGLGRGLWLAFHAVAIIAAGAAFHHLVQAWPGANREVSATAAPGDAHRDVFAACFLVGPLVESATGFGIGLIVAISLLRARAVTGAPAAVLAMLSQLLIPWGSLAISTIVGADLADVAFPELARACAAIAAVLLLAVLPVFWRLVGRALVPPSWRQRAVDLVLVGLLGALLFGANRFGAIEPAVLLAAGTLLALQAGGRAWRSGCAPDLLAVLPYLILVAAVTATRLIPDIRDALTGVAVFDLTGSGPAFALFHHPASWLLATIAISLAVRPGAAAIAELARQTVHTAWRPAVATVLFLALGRVLVTGAIPGQLVAPWAELAGEFATLATPLVAAAAGAVAASNLAATGMVMPLQAALAEAGRGTPLLIAAIQNVVAAAFTALSPARVALAASLLDMPGGERTIYRAAAGLALTILGVGFCALVVAW